MGQWIRDTIGLEAPTHVHIYILDKSIPRCEASRWLLLLLNGVHRIGLLDIYLCIACTYQYLLYQYVAVVVGLFPIRCTAAHAEYGAKFCNYYHMGVLTKSALTSPAWPWHTIHIVQNLHLCTYLVQLSCTSCYKVKPSWKTHLIFFSVNGRKWWHVCTHETNAIMML